MGKIPSLQFYPGDWLKDPAVRSVSFEARGLWIDMLCLMHESDRRGFLQHATGKPVTAEQLARMTGCSTDDVSRLLQELYNSGVYSCTDHGVIFNRRMAKDERFRVSRVENGKKGGRPKITYPKPTGEATKKLNLTPSSSSSSSIPPIPSGIAPPPDRIRFGKFVLLTAEERQKLGECFGEAGADDWIERLNRYAEKIGEERFLKKYDSGGHYATILSWAERDGKGVKVDGSDGKNGSDEKKEDRKEEITAYRALLEEREEVQERFREVVIDKLREEMSEISWEQYIKPLLVVTYADGALTLFHEWATWVQDHYAERIRKLTAVRAVKVTDEVEG